MGFDAWLTLGIIVVTMVLLASDRFSAAAVILGAVIVLLLAGVIDESQAFSGFSNPAPITVAALYVLAGAAEATAALERFTDRILGSDNGEDRGHSRRLARILLPVGGASAFVANTPLVTMLAPRILVWARRTGRSAAPYLMPLSYASIFGGVITVLGTSTNLVVSGLLTDSGQRPLGVFEITRVGLPIAILGITATALLAPRLLPVRTSPSDRVRRRAREYTVEMQVAAGGPLAGCSVTEAGLRQLQGLYLVGIARGEQMIAPVAPEEVLRDGDHLTFVGNARQVVDLQGIAGLVSAEERQLSAVGDIPERRIFEVVIAEGSSLAGSTLAEAEFRGRFGGAVFAVHRAGEQLTGKLGTQRLRAHDVLVVLADPAFLGRWRDDPEFLVVSPLGAQPPPRRTKARLVELVMLGLIVVSGTELLSLPKAALVAALVVVALQVISPAQARRSVNLDILVVIAASFGLGAAMAESGLAARVGDLLVGAFEPMGEIGVLVGILLATVVATELLTNNAAAVLMFPIAMASAEHADIDPRPLAIAILIAASCSFLTPIGYQTNTIVYGLGGYRFTDFARLGAPLTLLTVVSAAVLIPVMFPL